MFPVLPVTNYSISPMPHQPWAVNFCYGPQDRTGFFFNDLKLMMAYSKTTAENYKLHKKQENAELREEAYRAWYEDELGYHTKTKTGGIVYFLKCKLKGVIRFNPDKECNIAPFFLLFFDRGKASPLRIDVSDFDRDRSLVSAIQSHTGTSITRAPTQKNSVDLIRQIIETKERVIDTPFRSGWSEVNEQIRFLQFAKKFTSHQGSDQLLPIDFLDKNYGSLTFSKSAAELMSPSFEMIVNPTVRALLFLVLHHAFLSSLVNRLDRYIPLGICLCCANARVENWCQELFSLYGDPAIPLDLSASAFCRALSARKDQAAVILDRRYTKNAKTNSDLLKQAVASGYIDNRKGDPISLASLPVVISQSATELSCSPLFLTISISDEDINWGDGFEPVAGMSEYFASFACYVEEHISKLKDDLRAGRKWAMGRAKNLTSEATAMLGCLFGVWSFLSAYYNQEHISIEFNDLVAPAVFPEVLPQLEELSLRDNHTNDAGLLFLDVIRDQLQDGTLHSCEWIRRKPLDTANLESKVLYNADSVYIISDLVDKICAVLSFSRPTVMRDLKELGVLCGTPVNDETSLTRITLRNESNRSQISLCLQLHRSALEKFGEQEILGG